MAVLGVQVLLSEAVVGSVMCRGCRASLTTCGYFCQFSTATPQVLPQFCSTASATVFVKWALKVLNDTELLSDKCLKSSCFRAVKSCCSF